ncbi:MAG: hypothetical protein KDA25_09055 [Phycisphaerales bacterium]|nr:hypothetical protein [Phycisphaerales bacterium]
MTTPRSKSLMRNLGEFFGHLAKAVRTDPAKDPHRTVVRTEVEEEDRGDVILRRTTIEEVEVRRDASKPTTPPPPRNSPPCQ